MPRNVHLVGSIGLDTVDEVFATCGSLLGPYLKRVPDGEPGGRRLWISWQFAVLRANSYLQPDTSQHRAGGIGFHPMKLADGVKPEDVRFGELGYALLKGARFQVSLPTPFAVIGPFCVPEARQPVLRAYEQAMLREVAAICTSIPHRDLAIQWDVCIEMVIWDGGYQSIPAFPGMDKVFGESFTRLAGAVPADVELGFHLCYGDLDAAHFVEPRDAAKMVTLAHLIVESAKRPLQWIHMPVPIARSDDAFFAPLRGLAPPTGTELYLGLVHAADGVEGTRRRMETASRSVKDYGIASECGIARARRPELVRQILQTHADAARAG
jgi:hypothetical protein